MSEKSNQAAAYETNQTPELLVLSESFFSADAQTVAVLESLRGMKLSYQCMSCEQAREYEMRLLPDTVRAVILCGTAAGSALEGQQAEELLRRGIALIYTQLPQEAALRVAGLQEMLGIRQINGMMEQTGVRFTDDVFLGGLLDLQELEDTIRDVKLQATCKVYAYALDDDAADKAEKVVNEHQSPILWRNSIYGSKVFVVNGSFFEKNQGYGILTAMLSDIYEDFLYPIVNASVMLYDSLPYAGHANEELLTKLYARSSQKVQTDILIPSIISICKRLALVPTFCTTADCQLTQTELEYFERSVLELGGEILDKEDEQTVAVDMPALGACLWGNTQGIPITADGFRKTDDNMARLYAIASTFGIIVHRVDMSSILEAASADDDWVLISKDYTNNIAAYQEDFGCLTSRTATDALAAYMEYVLMQPAITYAEDWIDVTITYASTPAQASFLLRTEKEIQAVTNGTYTKLGDGIYLIQTTEEALRIDVKERDNDHYQG